MVQTTADKIHDYDMMCIKVRELDPKIKFAGVVNERGRLVAGGVSETANTLVDARTDEMLFFCCSSRIISKVMSRV